MAPRREILDSDDEDYEVSPVKSPAAPAQHNDQDQEAFRNRRAESTDPSFFREVYNNQRVATSAEKSSSSLAAALNTEPGSTLSSPHPPVNLSLSRIDHLSSITDPVPTRRGRQKKSDMKGVVDLTQVTTPGRPTLGAPVDIWDFPASQDDGGGSRTTQTASTKKLTIKVKKADTKRTRNTLNSSMQSPEQQGSGLMSALSVTQAEQGVDTTASEPRRKRRKISSSGEAGPNSQNVDLLVIPRSEDKMATNDYITPSNGGKSSSVIEDSVKARPTSLLVVPVSTLTASQRVEYKFVSLSSEHDDLGAATAAAQVDELQRSSGDATIKYPTPTGYGSSGPGALNPGDYETASSSRPRRRRKVVDDDPPSSPDVISAPVLNPRQKGNSVQINADLEDPYMAASSPPPPLASRRGRQRGGVDDLPSPGLAIMENEPLRSSGRVKVPSRKCQEQVLPVPTSSDTANADTIVTLGKASNQVAEEVRLPPTQIGPPEKKRRGRKRKEALSQAVADEALQQAEDTLAAVPEESEEVDVEPAPKRRGRQKKKAPAESVAVEDEDFHSAPDETAASAEVPEETPKPKKKGRPRKSDTTQATQPEVLPDQKEARGHDDRADEQQLATDSQGRGETTEADTEKTKPLSERDSNSNIWASPTKLAALTETDALGKAARKNDVADTSTRTVSSKGDKKPATPSSQPGKVQYRVGLSRRSRIAPLLKSFRK